jgi:hypothetical protein
MASPSMTVQNYYTFSEQDLDRQIADIRKWLVYNKDNENRARAYFALKVALSAKENINSQLDLSWL